MGKYIGPKTKIARKFGEPIFGADKAFTLPECTDKTVNVKKFRSTVRS